MTLPAITVTDEMRRAVYDADCAALGHLLDVSNAIGSTTGVTGPGNLTVIGPDDNTIANITCRRCHKVWLVIEDPANNYDDAVAALKGRVKDPSTVKPHGRPAKLPTNPNKPPLQ